EGANRPGDQTYQALRTGQAGPMPWIKINDLLGELKELEQNSGTRVKLLPPASGHAAVELSAGVPLTRDRMERVGTLKLEVAVSLIGRSTPVVERVRAERAFR